jgi:hypothetical protein
VNDFRIDGEPRFPSAKLRKGLDMDLRFRLHGHFISVSDMRLTVALLVFCNKTRIKVIACNMSAPLAHCRMDDYGQLFPTAYDHRGFLAFINESLTNMATLWSMHNGHDITTAPLTHFYF